MTLKELLNLKLVQDNVRLLVFTKDCAGLGNFAEEYNVIHIMGRCVVEADLVKVGVREELFNYKVKELWGDRHIFKMGIVIEKE